MPAAMPGRPPAGRRSRRGGLVGAILTALAAIWVYGKYALLLVGKFGILKTGLTLLISLGLLYLTFGPGYNLTTLIQHWL